LGQAFLQLSPFGDEGIAELGELLNRINLHTHSNRGNGVHWQGQMLREDNERENNSGLLNSTGRKTLEFRRCQPDCFEKFFVPF
jgi:hypothetical protein